MPESPTLDRVAAKRDPATFFASPEDVAQSILLTTGEKLATLARWRSQLIDELQLPAAANRAHDMLAAIDDTIRRLSEVVDASG